MPPKTIPAPNRRLVVRYKKIDQLDRIAPDLPEEDPKIAQGETRGLASQDERRPGGPPEPNHKARLPIDALRQPEGLRDYELRTTN
jgi:hypothetical protein